MTLSSSSRIVYVALFACSGSSAPPPGPDASQPPSVVLTGTPIVATAKLGTGESLIGTTTDADFNQVSGDTIFDLHADANGAVHTTQNQIKTGWIQTENTNELAANIAGWGIGSGALDAGNKTRYMSMRAYNIDYFEDVDLTKSDKTAPPTAIYFVSKIYFGHSFEALFSGTETTFTAAVAATLPKASGSIMDTASSDNLMWTNVGNGLTPTSGQAIFAQSETDVMNGYTAAGEAVPIYVEYRLIPGAAEPPGTPIKWDSPFNATIAIDEIDVFHNGAFLDASNTSWNVTATCSVNGAIVAQNVPVWTQDSVSAGGTDVNQDGTGPQDPNTGSPSSTYGRYGSLPFSKSVPISDGNTLRCDLGGERTDPSTPVALPNVTIEVPVATSTNVDSYSGNYDAGNHLDYLVHYTVTYTAN